MQLGGRFDPEAVRRKALEEKKKALRKKIVSNCISALMLIALAAGAKYGWDRWQDYREEKRAEAEAKAAREAREKAEAERKRKEKAAEREAERKQRERERREKAEAERIRKETERRLREEEKLRIEAEREAEKRRQREAEEWQAQYKPVSEAAVAKLKFEPSERVVCAYALKDHVHAEVKDERWGELKSRADASDAIALFNLVNDSGAVTNAFSSLHYPDRDTLNALLAQLDKERFTMTVTLEKDAPNRNSVYLLSPDPAAGLSQPAGCREINDGNKFLGWTVPFAFGYKGPFFVLTGKAATAFNREWRATRAKIQRDAAKVANKDEFAKQRLESEMEMFVDSIRARLAMPPAPDEDDDKKTREEAAKKRRGRDGDDDKRDSLRSFSRGRGRATLGGKTTLGR